MPPLRRRADITIATIQVPPEEAVRYGVAELETTTASWDSKRSRSTAIPKRSRFDPAMVSASMGIYVLDTEVLLQALHESASSASSCRACNSTSVSKT